MFPFDTSALPQLTTRRALICVDFQYDFISSDGALPVTQPDGYFKRVQELAAAFHETKGDVIWVKSKFEARRPTDSEQIILSDDPPSQPPAPLSGPEGRARRRLHLPAPVIDGPAEPAGPTDAEAFLSHDSPVCLKNTGSEWTQFIKESIAKSDVKLTKTHYSAFKHTQLLRILRAKMVMEIFICGSLANVGVHATAMDAAGHGLSITIVEDCCGYRDDLRQRRAVQGLMEFTGCEVATAEEVLEMIQPLPPKPKRSELTPICQEARKATERISNSPDIIRPMTGLRLATDSPVPANSTMIPHHDNFKLEVSNETHIKSKAHPVHLVDGAAPVGQSESQAPKPSRLREGSSAAAAPVLAPESSTRSKDVQILMALKEKPENNAEMPNDNTAVSSSTATTKLPSADDVGRTDLDSLHNRGKKSNVVSGHDKNDQLNTDPDLGKDVKLPQKGLCEGDTDVLENLLPQDLEDNIFDKIRNEIQWQRMSHQGGEVPRLVAVQGQVAEDGSIPVYRHPSDESPHLLPFSPTVLAIKTVTEKHLGHSLNHALIQFYRDGNDYISEHSDKTLDIVRDSYIANVSLGAERTMVFRTKRRDKDSSCPADNPVFEEMENPNELKKRRIQRARLPHNSLCCMGFQTNMKWLHAIRQDKRSDRDKSPAEMAYKGARISLTFRQIGTFLSKDSSTIWGQGATGKTREDSHAVINGNGPEVVAMLRSFGTENHASIFDWNAQYGKGFDVLHMSSSPRFFASQDCIVNMRIYLMLAELGVNYAKGSTGIAENSDNMCTDDLQILFMDNDEARSRIEGDVAIMLYLDAIYGRSMDKNKDPSKLAKIYTRFQQGLVLHKQLQRVKMTAGDRPDVKFSKQILEHWPVYRDLKTWDNYAKTSSGFLAGSEPSLPDFVVWPLLYSLVREEGLDLFGGLDNLKKYFETYGARDSVRKVTKMGTHPNNL